MSQTTVDKLLGGRFAVEQPSKGYRIAVDTLLLAASIQAQAGQSVLDLGCGVGGVLLALATRETGIHVTGLELQPEMAALCDANIKRNGFADRAVVHVGDVSCPPVAFRAAFDHVMMNPPYHNHHTHTVSSLRTKRLAHAESDEADLSVWIEQGASCLRPGGVLWMIHRADRIDEITALMVKLFAIVCIKPIVAREGAIPKRVIIAARQGVIQSQGERRVLVPFNLYGPDEQYSDEAQAVLRHAQAMPFESF